MKTPAALLLAALLLLPTLAPAARPGTQPRMENALEALKAARESKEPLPFLEKAERLVRRPGKRIGERRDEGADAIAEAIAVVKKGQDPTAKITHAIAIVTSAEDRRKSSNVK